MLEDEEEAVGMRLGNWKVVRGLVKGYDAAVISGAYIGTLG